MGQIWSKITQPRRQNENLTFFGQKISILMLHPDMPTSCSSLQKPKFFSANIITELQKLIVNEAIDHLC